MRVDFSRTVRRSMQPRLFDVVQRVHTEVRTASSGAGSRPPSKSSPNSDTATQRASPIT